jgi:hypothetical protein
MLNEFNDALRALLNEIETTGDVAEVIRGLAQQLDHPYAIESDKKMAALLRSVALQVVANG